MRLILKYSWLILTFISVVWGEGLNWESFTDKNSINGLSLSNDTLIISNLGGLSVFDIANHEFINYTKSDGLSVCEMNTALLNNGVIWAGTIGGYLNSVNLETENIRNYNEFDGVSRNVSSIVQYAQNNMVFVSGDDGIAVFRNGKLLRLINDMNGLVSKDVKHSLVNNDTLWVLTEQALSFFPLEENINNPQLWTNIMEIGDKTVWDYKRMYFYQGDYWLLGERSLAKIEVNDLMCTEKLKYVHNSSSVVFNDMDFVGDSIFIAGSYNLYFFDPENNTLNGVISCEKSRTVAYDEKRGVVWIGSLQKGLCAYDLKKSELVNYPNNSGPASNVVYDFDFIDDEKVVFACGEDLVYGKRGGLSIYDYDSWRNDSTTVRFSDFRGVAYNRDGLWLASFGSGLVKVEEREDSLIYKVYNNKNSPLKSPVNDFYVPVTNLDVDEYGNLWLLNYGGGVFVPIRPENEEWVSFGTYPLASSEPTALKVNYNYVWVGTKSGFYLLDYGNSLNYPSPVWSQFNSSNVTNMSNNEVFDIEMDRYGMPWVATGNGPIYQSGGNWWAPWEDPNYFINSQINDICVDEYNNKYYGTDKKGVIVSIRDTVRWYYYNEDNSPLLSNRVYKIKINPKDNSIWIATDKGVNVIRETLLVPKNGQDSILVYPNPFLLNKNIHGKLIFDRLSAGSKIMIFTIDGALIRRIDSVSNNMGRLEWDGKNRNGDYVGPGVYIYQIVDNENNVTGGKILVK